MTVHPVSVSAGSSDRDPGIPADLGRLLLRTILAVVFVYHGAWKLGAFGGPGLEGTADIFGQLAIPFPTLSAIFVAALELVGGVLLLLGLGTRITAALLAVTMVVALSTAHSGFSAAANGIEYPLTLAVASAAIALLGPGRYALVRLVPESLGPRWRATLG